MPRVFVYEFLTGGGTLGQADLPPPSLLREGQAMAAALAADFAACESTHVALLRDHRLPSFAPPGCEEVEVATATEEEAAFRRLAAKSNWTVVIAPELDGILLSRCVAVVAAGARLLGPGCDLVRLAADKHATAEYLQATGIPVPHGIALSPGQLLPRDFPCPAVLKPRDGCGSTGLRLVHSPSSGPLAIDVPSRFEHFCPGMAASVAILSGPNQHFVLPPCQQRLSDDGRFQYLGGSLPLPKSLARRAVELAQRVVAAIPPFIGYLGIDLVLGGHASGRDDFVIEINPRLTTSYVGLRAAARQNLAAAMLEIAGGNSVDLTFAEEVVEFDACGTVQRPPATKRPLTSRAS